MPFSTNTPLPEVLFEVGPRSFKTSGSLVQGTGHAARRAEHETAPQAQARGPLRWPRRVGLGSKVMCNLSPLHAISASQPTHGLC